MSIEDRGWMYRRRGKDGIGISDEFEEGLCSFIEFAIRQPRYMDGDKIRCLCKKECKNKKYVFPTVAYHHIRESGFINNYFKWISHGEVGPHRDIQVNPGINLDQHDPMDVDDVGFDDGIDDGMASMTRDAFKLDSNSYMETSREEQPNPEAKKLYDTLNAANQKLYDGCDQSLLLAVAQLLNIKAETNMSENAYNRMMSTFKSLLPKQNLLPENFYETKKLVSSLGLGLQKIDACKNDCMLFYKENINLTKCVVCGADRYKPKRRGSSKHKKNIPWKVLRFLPLGPRLQRLYSEALTAQAMRWHKESPRQDGVLTHPSDGEAWKHFDMTYPDFAFDPRNVRLCLSADGFNPFGPSTKSHSCWPVIVTPYNIPPWMCMKEPYMFLTLFIPGPSSPCRSIDVYLQPLIDELEELWKHEVETFDAYKKENFKLRAALMWTVNDFPAYGMLSGWSTHGRLSCPYCMDRTKAFQLDSENKRCFFYCHRQFLPTDHPFRRKKNLFTKGRVEEDLPPPRLTGDEIRGWVDMLPSTNWGQLHSKERPEHFGKQHNWTKKSIFWQLPYWSTNLIRHNLDVMHIEKNVFENVFNTVMNIKGKTKDTAKARMDLEKICNRKDLELIEKDGKTLMPKAPFTLSNDQKKMVLEWIQGLRLPDGFSSNIGKCVNMKEGTMQGMKSHDCHIFLDKLLPIAFRDFLPDHIWDALAELSQFFRTICSSVLYVDALEELEAGIAVTLCKLEQIFPPAFFDSMEHLPVHLAYEARVGGPVQYRWMYPFERFLNVLKRKVGNKARVEGSIYEAYVILEVASFTSKYFDADIETKSTRVGRNDDGGASVKIKTDKGISVFCPPGRFLHQNPVRKRMLSDAEWDAAPIYVLLNCNEVDKYVKMFEASVRDKHVKDNLPPLNDQQMISKTELEFEKWFQELVKARPCDRDLKKLESLAWGPGREVHIYNGYFINGYVFHTISYGADKSAMNSGVCLKGGDCEYYGMLREVIELKYLKKGKVVLFNCKWYDSQRGIKLHHKYDIVDGNHKYEHPGNDVFILASQAQQVYVTPYPYRKRGMNDWWAVLKTRARSTINIPYKESCGSNPSTSSVEYYQEDEMPFPPHVEMDIDDLDDVPVLLPEGIELEEVAILPQNLRGSHNATLQINEDGSSTEEEEDEEDEYAFDESDEEEPELEFIYGEESSGEDSSEEDSERDD